MQSLGVEGLSFNFIKAWHVVAWHHGASRRMVVHGNAPCGMAWLGVTPLGMAMYGWCR